MTVLLFVARVESDAQVQQLLDTNESNVQQTLTVVTPVEPISAPKGFDPSCHPGSASILSFHVKAQGYTSIGEHVCSYEVVLVCFFVCLFFQDLQV